jgi:hypothetical protein
MPYSIRFDSFPPLATGQAAAANTSPLQPAVEDDSEEETEGDDDDEMEDNDDDHRLLYGQPDEALAGAIHEVAEKPDAALAFEVAKEMLARFRELRKRTNGVKKTEESSKGFGSVGSQEMIAESVVRWSKGRWKRLWRKSGRTWRRSGRRYRSRRRRKLQHRCLLQLGLGAQCWLEKESLRRS